MPWVAQISKISRTRSAAWPWAISLLCFAASLGTRILLDPALYGLKFLTFYPAICIATLVGGWPHGLLVLVLSALSALYFFVEPFYSFEIRDGTAIGALVGFLVVGGFILVLVAALREVVSRLERAKLMQEVLFRDKGRHDYCGVGRLPVRWWVHRPPCGRLTRSG